MNGKLLTVLALFSSLPAFAGGGSSIGGSACSFAAVVCNTNEASAADQTLVCVFGDSDDAVVVTPDADRSFENIKLQPNKPGDLGAPLIYSGKGFELVYVNDASERPGYLYVPSLALDGLPMSCTGPN